jgi:hypothetical protein
MDMELALGHEPRSQPTDQIDVVASSASRCEDALAQSKQTDVTQQVVQDRQRRQVFLDGGGAIDDAPAGIRLLDLPYQGARQAAAWCQLHPVGGQAHQESNGCRNCAHGLP